MPDVKGMAGKALQESVGGKLDIKSGLGGLLKKKKRLERRLRDLTVRGYQPIPIKKGGAALRPQNNDAGIEIEAPGYGFVMLV